MSANATPTQALPADGRIELAFDRLLLPASITRQSFSLRDLQKNVLSPPPTVAYDPVARIVTITPASALQADQMYRIEIVSPQGPNDPSGLHAIDGATLGVSSLCPSGSSQTCVIEFPVTGAGASAQPSPPTVDFCRDVLPIFQGKCGGSSCHGGTLPASGLLLDSPTDIKATAIGQVAHGSNSGPRSTPQAPGFHFGIDMPIIEPGSGASAGGDPGQSWLLYKALLAAPPAQSVVSGASACDGGTAAPTDVSTMHILAWQPMTDGERAALSNLVLGREMPFPVAGTPPGRGADALTLAELERISRWIAQPPAGATTPTSCASCIQ